MDEHPLICYGDLQNISTAFSKKDLQSFRRLLHSAIDVESYDNETSVSIFEHACQQPNSELFIEECLAIGCDVNKENPFYKKYPINFAVESFCPANLQALLKDPNVNVDKKFGSNTPVNFLCEKITDDTFDGSFHCIQLLISHHADLNIGNMREITPILQILRNKNLNQNNKKTIAEYMLDHVIGLDLDIKRKGEARSLLENLLPKRKLPAVQSAQEEWDFNKLMACLHYENERQFLMGINAFVNLNSTEKLTELFSAIENDETLLISAVKHDLVMAVERMLRLGADINYGCRRAPIEYACIFGHWRSLDLLLKSPTINIHTKEPLLTIVVKNIGEPTTNKCNYDKCLQILLKNKNIYVDQQDTTKSSALHYAVKYNNSHVITDLLINGAYVGIKNAFNQYSISNINPKLLEKHLDSCITTNQLRSGEDNFEIIFDYTNLVPSSIRFDTAKGSLNCNEKNINDCVNEMGPISFMSQSNDLRHLIRHPLIASFLFLKWQRLAFIFYVNFLLCTLFSGVTVSYILFCYEDTTSGLFNNVLWAISFCLLVYIMLREVFQLVLSPSEYIKNCENFLEILLIIFTLIILTSNNDTLSESIRKMIASATILLIAIEIFILAGSLPFWSFSTHYVMLITVSKSFLKSLCLYAIILLAFSLSFFTLLRQPTTNKRTDNDDEDSFNKFGNIGLSIMKTIVMSTGEFDAASINFDLNTWSYVIFVIFLFLISTVLFNLLNGLAVSDTQVIKSEAELTNFIHRTKLLTRYERVLMGQENSVCHLNYMKYFSRNRLVLFKKSISSYLIRVKPNDQNQIYFETMETNDKLRSISIEDETMGCFASGCFYRGSCSRMEKKIIKLAFNILEKRKQGKFEELEKEQLMNRICYIENSLHSITQKLDIIMNK